MTPLSTLAYDANGNTLPDAQGVASPGTSRTGRYKAVNPGVGTTTFRYDPFGRRIQKSGLLGTTNYLYDGMNSVEEVDSSGNVLAHYAQGDGMDELLSQLRAGTSSYYERDGSNSVSSLSSGAGALANTYSYDSFGKLTNSTGTITNPFQFTGREFDQETGIYEYRARYYDGNTGRFLSEDPDGFEAGDTDFYRYAANDPNDFIDPTGNVIVPQPGPAPTGGLNLTYYYAALGYLGDDPGCSSVIRKLQNSPRIFTLNFVNGTENDGYEHDTHTISWDPLGGSCDHGCSLSPAIALCHEMAHAAGDGPIARHLAATPDNQYDNQEERRVINNYENPFAMRHGECVRFNHSGHAVHVATPTSH